MTSAGPELLCRNNGAQYGALPSSQSTRKLKARRTIDAHRTSASASESDRDLVRSIDRRMSTKVSDISSLRRAR